MTLESQKHLHKIKKSTAHKGKAHKFNYTKFKTSKFKTSVRQMTKLNNKPKSGENIHRIYKELLEMRKKKIQRPVENRPGVHAGNSQKMNSKFTVNL